MPDQKPLLEIVSPGCTLYSIQTPTLVEDGLESGKLCLLKGSNNSHAVALNSRTASAAGDRSAASRTSIAVGSIGVLRIIGQVTELQIPYILCSLLSVAYYNVKGRILTSSSLTQGTGIVFGSDGAGSD